jgi:hypothetical protein
MFDDFKELLSIFHDHSVKYLIVGGYAVSFHAQPRATSPRLVKEKHSPVSKEGDPKQ